MKKYYSLTEQEKLALTSADFTEAVMLESIERGIAPPITLENQINQVGFTGWSLPPDAVMFYEVVMPGRYETVKSGLCFKTPEEARKACVGAVSIQKSGYPEKNTLMSGEFTVQECVISGTMPKSLSLKLEEFKQDTTKFDELTEECGNDMAKIRQDRYNKEVRSQKRKQFLALAQGNEEIANSFWSRTESGEFPTE